MKRFFVLVVVAIVGCGPTKEEAIQAYSDALISLGKLRANREAVVTMSIKEVSEFDSRIDSAIENIKAGQEDGREQLFAVIKERDAVVAKWAADLERRDAVILEQKAALEEAVMAAGPEAYAETPNLANDAIPQEAHQSGDTVTSQE
jgi:hypothetical protein